jgi:chemotaxis protein CheD
MRSNLAVDTRRNVITVGIAELATSSDPEATIITHALGSCVAVVLWEPTLRIGGMLHYLLPTEKGARPGEKAPEAFADVGIPRLFEAMYRAGAKKENILVRAAGGAAMGATQDVFAIGARNQTALKKILWKNSVSIRAEDLGGSVSRTVWLEVGSGKVFVRTPDQEREL